MQKQEAGKEKVKFLWEAVFWLSTPTEAKPEIPPARNAGQK
jgi:hypothetical protein